jgi:hypothetical protein
VLIIRGADTLPLVVRGLKLGRFEEEPTTVTGWAAATVRSNIS